jgi:hypothetical protein
VSEPLPSVPMLHPCIECGLPVEAGVGPGELAWHDCAFVIELRDAALPPPPPPPPGAGELIDRITQSLSRRADEINPRDLANVLNALAELRRAEAKSGEAGTGGSSTSLKLLAFISDG